MAFDAGSVYATLGGRFSSTGFHQFSSAMYKARAEMDATEKRQQEMAARSAAASEKIGHGAKVVAAGGILALAGVIGGSIKVAVDFEKQMRNVNSIAGLNERQFRSLRKEVLALSGPTAQTPKTLAAGMYQLVSSGFKAHEALSILKASAIAATAGLTTTEVATTAVAAALNAYHLPASDAQKVSDILFQTVNRGVITFEELANTIGLVLPFANSLHVGLDQVGAGISTLTKEGIPAANATTYLKNAMVAFLKPSKDLKAAIKETGAASGEQLVKTKGFQGALEAVAKTTDGTKGALQRLFPDIRASAAVFALTGSNAKTAEGDVKAFGNTAGATQKVFAEQSKSTAVQWQKFKAELATTGVVIGSAVLPVLTKAITAVGQWVSGLSRSGAAAKFGHEVAAGFKEAGTVLSDAWGIAKGVLSVLQAIAGALNLGNATNLEAILAAIVAFKVAGIVTPLIYSLAAGLTTLVEAAATAPTLAAFFADLSLGPVGLISAAVGGLAAALVLLGGQEDVESQLARHSAEAHKAQADAIRDVGRAEQEAANKGLAAERSTLNLKEARQALADATKKYGKNSDEYKRALLDERQATLDAKAAHQEYDKSIGDQNQKNIKLVATATKNLATAQKDLNNLNKQAADRAKSGANITTDPAYIKAHAQAVANVTRETQAYVQALSRANVSDLSRQRLMQASTQITAKNAQGVSLLIQSLQGVPKSVQAKLLVQDQDALGRLGKISLHLSQIGQHHTMVQILTNARSVQEALLAMEAVEKGVPPRKVLRIIHNADTAKGAIQQLHSAIDAIPASKQVTITTTHRDIVLPSGKHLPGAAAGGRTSGPQLYLVGEGRDPVEWIIPRDPQHRGRATALLMDAAKSILPGAAKGHKHTSIGGVQVTKPTTEKGALHLPIPAKIAQGGVPFEDVSRDRDAIHSQFAQAKKAHETATAHLAAQKHRLARVPANDAHHNYDRSRSNAKDAVKQAEKALHEAKAKEARLKPMADYADRLFRAARATDARAQKLQSTINLDTDYMSDADKKGDQGAYNTARDDRKKQTRLLITLLQRSLSLASPGSAYARTLREQLAALGGQAAVDGTKPTEANQGTFGGDLGDSELSTAEGQPPSELTKAEQDRLDRSNADIALAALTPDLKDDTTAAQSLVDFLGPLLDSAKADPGARGGVSAITDIAGQLKTARDNLASLADPGGGGTNDNPDLQAQLDQAREQVRSAQQDAATNAAWAAAAGSPGDIGAGGPSARAAASGDVHVHFESYVPPSPQEAQRLGEHVTTGLGYQGFKRSTRKKVLV